MAEQDPQSKLAYERETPGGSVTRRQGRWLITLLLLNTILLGANVLGTQLWPTLQQELQAWRARQAEAQKQQQAAAQLRQQEQQFLTLQAAWLQYDMPKGLVVFDTDPKRAAAALLTGKGYVMVPFQALGASVMKTSWQPPVLAPTTGPSATIGVKASQLPSGLLFLHERKLPNGEPKLVVATVEAKTTLAQAEYGSNKLMNVVNYVTLEVRAYHPAVAGAGSTGLADLSNWRAHELKLNVPATAYARFRFPDNNTSSKPSEFIPGIPLRLLAGEVDPADASHFTIPYLVGEMPGTIDVWLRADAIEIRPREGQGGTESSWTLPAPSF